MQSGAGGGTIQDHNFGEPDNVASLDVYRALFDSLLPRSPGEPIRSAEVFGVTPERYDPFAAGFRQGRAFAAADALPTDRSYPVQCAPDASASIDVDEGILRVYVGPVEWMSSNDVVVEAGLSVRGLGTRHWVWRLERVDGAWKVRRQELVWRT